MPFDTEKVLSQLSNNEKATLLSGFDFWHTAPLPAHDIPSIRVSDGPNGVRGTKLFGGVPAACLPCGTGLGATWDKNLLNQAGVLLGQECVAKGAHCWLGPTINIQRSPLGGRGFESFSEDPFLSGKLASSIIKGCESTGVTACVKHFVANDQEHERMAVNSIVTQRALREVYMRPFQIVAREVKPGALMTSYNKVNGIHVSEDQRLLEEVVRKEWGWNPLIMSDWYGTYSTARAIDAGLDLEMPGASRYRGLLVGLALSARVIKQSTLDSRARRVLEFINHASKLKVNEIEGRRDTPEDRILNRSLCSSSIVLLKNDDNVLPLSKSIQKLALIGSHMKSPAISGGGSASLEPYYTISLYDAIQEKLSSTAVEIRYEVGAYAHKTLPVIERLLTNGTLNFYNEPLTVKDRQCLGKEPLSRTFFQLMDFNIPKLNTDLFYGTLDADFTPDYTGTWDFGLTVFGSGDLYVDGEKIVDNSTTQTRGDAFFGMGTVEERGCKDLVEGQVYKIKVEFGSSKTSKVQELGVVGFGGGAVKLGASLKFDIDEQIENAAKAAADADVAILCTGLNSDWESEGYDRKHMNLPPNIDRLITRVLEANPRTIIVNQSGTPVTMPFASAAKCIVQAWYGGNETGNGIADVLFGDVNAGGKLPLSWPVALKHNPAFLSYESVGGRVLYSEDVYVGYKYYEKTEVLPLFPFGHGLSYTTFSLTDLSLKDRTISVTVTNTGTRAGAEVVQVYVAAQSSPTPRPSKELHGFEKVSLEPQESRLLEIEIDKYATSFWDESEDMWKSEKGVYDVLVGTSSADANFLVVPLEVEMTSHWLGL